MVIVENHVIRKAGIAIDVDTAAKTQLYRCVIRNGDRGTILNRQGGTGRLLVNARTAVVLDGNNAVLDDRFSRTHIQSTRDCPLTADGAIVILDCYHRIVLDGQCAVGVDTVGTISRRSHCGMVDQQGSRRQAMVFVIVEINCRIFNFKVRTIGCVACAVDHIDVGSGNRYIKGPSKSRPVVVRHIS